MKNLVLCVSLLASNQIFAGEKIALSGEYDLVEYYFSVVAGIDTPVHCVKPEIDKGLVDLLWMGSGKTPGHQLKPSYHPLERNAAWLVSGEACISQRPYYNGIGFDYIDGETGQAVIYIAAFSRDEVDESKWRQSDGVGRMTQLFKPDFDVKNLNKFNAQCDFKVRSLPFIGEREFLGKSNELECELDDNMGHVKLKKR